MAHTYLLRRALAVVAFLPVAMSSQARERYAPAEPGDFDYLLLSLSIAPSFCALSPANRESNDLQPMPAASVGPGQNSGCPRGAGLAPDAAR